MAGQRDNKGKLPATASHHTSPEAVWVFLISHTYLTSKVSDSPQIHPVFSKNFISHSRLHGTGQLTQAMGGLGTTSNSIMGTRRCLAPLVLSL